MTTTTTSGRPQRIDAVDGLRAIAMTMVVAQHCGLLYFGWTGVWLFLVISGYVITLGFVNGAYEAGGRSATYAAFIGRRAQRIVPVYLLYVAAGALVLLASGDAARLVDLPYLLTFTFNWHMVFQFWPGLGASPVFDHLWTLSIEQQFYLLFPLLALFVPQRRQALACALLIAAGPLLRWWFSQWLEAGAAVEPGRYSFAVYAATHCHADAFLIGSLIARLEPRLRESPVAAGRVWMIAIAVAVGYASAYAIVNRQLGATGVNVLRDLVSGTLYGQHREVFVYLVIDLLAAAVLLHAVLGRAGARLLAWRPLAWVGRVSYGGYLFHVLVLLLFEQWVIGALVKGLPVPQQLLAFAVVWLATVLLASASYAWFEVPIARRWSRRTKQGRMSTALTRAESA